MKPPSGQLLSDGQQTWRKADEPKMQPVNAGILAPIDRQEGERRCGWQHHPIALEDRNRH
jgi:hypothetical protein